MLRNYIGPCRYNLHRLPNLDEFRTFAADIQETVNRSCYISLQPMAESSFAYK